jgi:protein disulfide-isomerase
MKYLLIIVLASMVAVLSCSPAPKSDTADAQTQETTEIVNSSEYEPGTWIDNWDLAIAVARETGRTVLVNFTGSDWCSWCIKLASEVFEKKAFEAYAQENLVLLKLDFPRKIAQSAELKMQNNNLQRQFGIQGYPTILLVNAEGKEIGRTGYQPGGPDAYIKHLGELMKK